MARSKFLLTGLGAMIIPVKKVKVSSEIGLPMKEIHAVEGCGHTLGRKTWCSKCNKEVGKEEKGKGYARNDKDEFPVPFTKEEIASLHPNDIPEATIQITNFVTPLEYKWFDGSHAVLLPQETNPTVVNALALLYQTLEKTGKVALCRYWDSNTEYNAVLNSNGILSGIFYGDEVKDVTVDLAIVKAVQPNTQLNAMFEKLIKLNTKPFDPVVNLKNVYREQVTASAFEKMEKGTFTITASPATPVVDPNTDLLALLTQSIEDAEKSVAEPVAKTSKKKKSA